MTPTIQNIQKQTIYHIFLDRFAGEMKDAELPVFAGGSFNAATERLGYIAALGFTAVWLSPFCKTAAYHGYHITDFYMIDEHFGTEADLQTFIDTAHELGLKVYADFVPNHLSIHHPFFVSAQTDRHSPYREWFYWDQWPKTYRSFLFYQEIPKINLNNPQAREHVIGAALHWAGKGLDGLRIDHAIGTPIGFNKEFYRRMKLSYPDIFIFGEVWADGITRNMFNTINIPRKAIRWLFSINQSQLQWDYRQYFDAILDFSVQKIIADAVKSERTESEIKAYVKKYFDKMPRNYTPVCFLDNHDMDRFEWQCGSIEGLKKAIAVLSALPAPIVLYYGTESGMKQSETIRSGKPFADLAVRQPMNWGSINTEMHQWVKNCIKIRMQA